MACKVGPSVTTAAAKAAIAALCDEASCPKDIFETTSDYKNSAADRFDSPTLLNLLLISLPSLNVKLSIFHRSVGDKDTSDIEEQQEEKGKFYYPISVYNEKLKTFLDFYNTY